MKFGEWTVGAHEAIKVLLADLTDEPVRQPGHIFPVGRYETLTVKQIVSDARERQTDLRLSTIHGVKGETVAGLLLVEEPHDLDGSIPQVRRRAFDTSR